MNKTTPETSELREKLARAHYEETAWGGCAGAAWGLTSEELRRKHYETADALLPVVAQEIAAAVADARADEIRGKADSLTGQLLIAAAEQRGREEVRTRVEALLPNRDAIRAAHHEMEDRGQECGCSYKDCYECGKWHNCTHGTTGLANDIRATLTEPAAEEHP